jgi:hypothetical protein
MVGDTGVLGRVLLVSSKRWRPVINVEVLILRGRGVLGRGIGWGALRDRVIAIIRLEIGDLQRMPVLPGSAL